MCLIFLMGMVPLIIGLINLFAPDIAWAITEFGNAISGVDSKRTEMWETIRPINGILLILTALFTFMFLMPLSQMRQTPYKSETTSTYQLITPTATECANVKELKYIDNTGKIAVTRIEFCS